MMDVVSAMPKYDEYRDSGVDWLGNIPHEWGVKKIYHLFRIGRGRVISQQELVDDGEYPVYSSQTKNNGVLGYIQTYDFDCDQVTWTTDGANAGTVFLRRGKHNCTNVCGTLQPFKNSNINLSFASYALSDITRFYKRPDTNGAKIMNNEMAHVKLMVPSYEEQSNIARFLDQKTTQIDDAISIKEKQIALLKERKQIIIQKAVTQGLNPDVPMKDCGVDWIGQIPEHWEMKRVKNIFRLVMHPSEKNNDHELLSVYTDIGVKPRRELEERGNKASTTDGYWFVKKGDIVVNKLLAWMGAIGLSEYDGVTSPAYDILRPQLPVDGHYYHYLFRSDFCSAELKRHSRGIMDMRLRLYFDKFGVIEVPYPPASEQNEIIRSLEVRMKDMDKGIDHLNIQIEKLKEYKATLINSAVTGKIKVA
jgi:type I restriction enzyme S subunit